MGFEIGYAQAGDPEDLVDKEREKRFFAIQPDEHTVRNSALRSALRQNNRAAMTMRGVPPMPAGRVQLRAKEIKEYKDADRALADIRAANYPEQIEEQIKSDPEFGKEPDDQTPFVRKQTTGAQHRAKKLAKRVKSTQSTTSTLLKAARLSPNKTPKQIEALIFSGIHDDTTKKQIRKALKRFAVPYATRGDNRGESSGDPVGYKGLLGAKHASFFLQAAALRVSDQIEDKLKGDTRAMQILTAKRRGFNKKDREMFYRATGWHPWLPKRHASVRAEKEAPEAYYATQVEKLKAGAKVAGSAAVQGTMTTFDTPRRGLAEGMIAAAREEEDFDWKMAWLANKREDSSEGVAGRKGGEDVYKQLAGSDSPFWRFVAKGARLLGESLWWGRTMGAPEKGEAADYWMRVGPNETDPLDEYAFGLPEHVKKFPRKKQWWDSLSTDEKKLYESYYEKKKEAEGAMAGEVVFQFLDPLFLLSFASAPTKVNATRQMLQMISGSRTMTSFQKFQVFRKMRKAKYTEAEKKIAEEFADTVRTYQGTEKMAEKLDPLLSRAGVSAKMKKKVVGEDYGLAGEGGLEIGLPFGQKKAVTLPVGSQLWGARGVAAAKKGLGKIGPFLSEEKTPTSVKRFFRSMTYDKNRSVALREAEREMVHMAGTYADDVAADYIGHVAPAMKAAKLSDVGREKRWIEVLTRHIDPEVVRESFKFDQESKLFKSLDDGSLVSLAEIEAAAKTKSMGSVKVRRTDIETGAPIHGADQIDIVYSPNYIPASELSAAERIAVKSLSEFFERWRLELQGADMLAPSQAALNPISKYYVPRYYKVGTTKHHMGAARRPEGGMAYGTAYNRQLLHSKPELGWAKLRGVKLEDAPASSAAADRLVAEYATEYGSRRTGKEWRTRLADITGEDAHVFEEVFGGKKGIHSPSKMLKTHALQDTTETAHLRRELAELRKNQMPSERIKAVEAQIEPSRKWVPRELMEIKDHESMNNVLTWVGRSANTTMNIAKEMQTIPNPRYHMKNVIGDVMLMFMGGFKLTPGNVAARGRQMNKILDDAVPDDELIQLGEGIFYAKGELKDVLRRRGIIGSDSLGRIDIDFNTTRKRADAMKRASMEKPPKDLKKMARRVATANLSEVGRDFAQWWDTRAKGMYLFERLGKGDSINKAVGRTFELLPDYAFERRNLVTRFFRVFDEYATWQLAQMKNLPKTMLYAPEKWIVPAKFTRDVLAQAGPTPTEETQNRGFGIYTKDFGPHVAANLVSALAGAAPGTSYQEQRMAPWLHPYTNLPFFPWADVVSKGANPSAWMRSGFRTRPFYELYTGRSAFTGIEEPRIDSLFHRDLPLGEAMEGVQGTVGNKWGLLNTYGIPFFLPKEVLPPVATTAINTLVEEMTGGDKPSVPLVGRYASRLPARNKAQRRAAAVLHWLGMPSTSFIDTLSPAYRRLGEIDPQEGAGRRLENAASNIKYAEKYNVQSNLNPVELSIPFRAREHMQGSSPEYLQSQRAANDAYTIEWMRSEGYTDQQIREALNAAWRTDPLNTP